MLDKLVEKVDGLLTLSFEDKCSLAAQGIFEFFEKQVHKREQEENVVLTPISIGNLLSQQQTSVDNLRQYIINTVQERHGDLSDREIREVKKMVLNLWQRIITPSKM